MTVSALLELSAKLSPTVIRNDTALQLFDGHAQ
jgi:hypothetical protein